jgi:pimeloyl-ACP methyl ester carboxylesterase
MANWKWIPATILLLVPACAQMPRQEDIAQLPLRPVVAPHHVLFVADGAGDFRACSMTVRSTAEADGWPIEVHTFVWSHGYLRSFADHVEYSYARERGRELAQRVMQQKQQRPDLPVSLMGHSDGSGVVLAAAEQLPPETLDRIVLFGPGLSVDYDLRPALRSVRNGVDVFWSPEDRVYLGAFAVLGGAQDDESESRTAGRYGFQPTNVTPEEVGLFGKLHQYEWNRTMLPTGNDGGHFGAYAPGHLRKFVLPLFQY